MREEVHDGHRPDRQDPGLLGRVETPPDEMFGAGAIVAANEAVPPPAPQPGAAAADKGGLTVETSVTLHREGGEAGKAGKGGSDDGEYGEFAWPDGYAADPEAMAKFLPMAKKFGLTKEAAQELTNLHVELEQKRNLSQAESVARNNAEWLREIQAHPEFGGAGLARTSENVASVLRRYGSPLLLAQFRQMNVQNWPEMFYFLARVSRDVSEDCSPSGSGQRAAPKSTAQLLFPGLK